MERERVRGTLEREKEGGVECSEVDIEGRNEEILDIMELTGWIGL